MNYSSLVLCPLLVLTFCLPLPLLGFANEGEGPAAFQWREGLPIFRGETSSCHEILKAPNVMFMQEGDHGLTTLPTGPDTSIHHADQFAKQLNIAGRLPGYLPPAGEEPYLRLTIRHLDDDKARELSNALTEEERHDIPILIGVSGVDVWLTPQAKRDAERDPKKLTARLKEAIALLYASKILIFQAGFGTKNYTPQALFVLATRELAGRFLHLMGQYDELEFQRLVDHLDSDLTQDFLGPTKYAAIMEGAEWSWEEAKRRFRESQNTKYRIAELIDLETGSNARIDANGQLVTTASDVAGVTQVIPRNGGPFTTQGPRLIYQAPEGKNDHTFEIALDGQSLKGLAVSRSADYAVVLATTESSNQFRLNRVRVTETGAEIDRSISIDTLGWGPSPRYIEWALLSPDGRYYAYYDGSRRQGVYVIDLEKLAEADQRSGSLVRLERHEASSPWIVQLAGEYFLRGHQGSKFTGMGFTPDSSHLNLLWESGFSGVGPRFISIRLED